MSTDIQPLLDRIHREGIAKAREDADALLETARLEAKNLLDAAKVEAEALRQAAEREAGKTVDQGRRVLEQAARDTMLRLRTSLQQMVQSGYEAALTARLSAPDAVKALLEEVVRAFGAAGGASPITVNLGSALHTALSDSLAAQLSALYSGSSVKVELDPDLGAGFCIHIQGDRAVHDFSEAGIAEWLSTQVRPELSAILKQVAKEN